MSYSDYWWDQRVMAAAQADREARAEQTCGHTPEEHAQFIRDKIAEKGLSTEIRHEAKRRVFRALWGN